MNLLRSTLVLLLLGAQAIACSDATGSSSGGTPLFDASTPPVPDAGTVPSCAKDGGATWGDLYRDCFGPTEAACGGTQCHATTSSPGGGVWACGSTPAECYAGIKTIIDNSDPTMTTLYGALRKDPSCGATCMPRSSNFTFEPPDLDRIKTWIANGAKND